MSASKQKYSAAEAASIISNWLAESADESASEVEDSDQIFQKMNKELFLRIKLKPKMLKISLKLEVWGIFLVFQHSSSMLLYYLT